MTPERENTKGSCGEIFRDRRGPYSALVISGIAMQATQMLVIAIIMPTIVADIGALIAARAAQGWAGGLVAGSGMVLITSLFDTRLRTPDHRDFPGHLYCCHLSGPIVGGLFAEINWWRSSFWGDGAVHAALHLARLREDP